MARMVLPPSIRLLPHQDTVICHMHMHLGPSGPPSAYFEQVVEPTSSAPRNQKNNYPTDIDHLVCITCVCI
jgi:hypothetical protein